MTTWKKGPDGQWRKIASHRAGTWDLTDLAGREVITNGGRGKIVGAGWEPQGGYRDKPVLLIVDADDRLRTVMLEGTILPPPMPRDDASVTRRAQLEERILQLEHALRDLREAAAPAYGASVPARTLPAVTKGSAGTRPAWVSAALPFLVPCADCGGRGAHRGPGHAYRFPE